MPVHVYKDIDALSLAVAEELVSLIGLKLKTQNRFTLLLSGGSTPKNLYTLLAEDQFKSRVDWERIHIFFGDERVVPFSDDRNNGRMAKESLLDHVPVPLQQIHYISTEGELIEAVETYENVLHQYFDNKPNSFDLALLGIGDDAHTLSFFPGSGVIYEKVRWVVSLYLEAQKMYRISLTPVVVNRSAKIFFLAAGDSKAIALKNVLQGEFRPDLYPAQLIKPLNGELDWYIDEAANELL